MTENPGAIPADAGAGTPAADAGARMPTADAGAGTPAADAPVIDVPSANTPQDAIPQVTATNVTVSYETADAAANAAGDGGDATAAPTPKRKRSLKWLWRVLVALVIAGLIALSVYMINVTNGWRDYSAQVEAALNDVKATAASSAADLSSTQARLDTVQTQLDTANARITELANEEANATDNQDALRNHMEAMIQCADDRQKLIDGLTTPNSYWVDGRSDAQVERDITQFCEAVKSDYQQYLAGN